MVDADSGLFTVAVFQDAAWAQKALQALARAGFAPASLTVIAADAPASRALIETTFGAAAQAFEMAHVGPVVARGPLVDLLQGASGDLARLGLAGTLRRAGFQSHDCRIFEVLTGRGGVLVAIRDEPRASDALAVCHSYGGGNAAIGAWHGRV
ncbi:MAG: hypothetical protein IT176_13080 [Acidobacteria bacterium]|nr:hypothetical protein [Acidobacteriota bacterium]